MPNLARALSISATVVAAALAAAPPALGGLLKSEGEGEGDAVGSLPVVQEHWLTLERTADGLRMVGRVPDELTRTVLTTYAAALFGADRVESEFTGTPADRGVPADWVQIAMAAADTLSEISSGTAEVTAEAVRLTGTLEVPERAGVLTRELAGKLMPGVQLSTRFSVKPPDLVATLTLSPERCAHLMTRLAAERQILFPSGSAEIDAESRPGLAKIASLFERCPDAEIEVMGFTDSEGPEDYNLELSQARAESVMQALLDAGVPLRRLRARGFGEADPIASNETEAGRARNRRIEFRAVEG